MKKIMVGNHAVSWGVMLARAEVISAYPITPRPPLWRSFRSSARMAG